MRLRFWHFLAASIVLATFALAGEAVSWVAERGHGGCCSTANSATAVLIAPRPQRVAPASTARRR